MKRTINGLSNVEEVISSHIQQLTPLVFAIGSLLKTKSEIPENERNFSPCLHVVSGDISDSKQELKISVFERPFLQTIKQKKSAIFRFLFVKER